MNILNDIKHFVVCKLQLSSKKSILIEKYVKFGQNLVVSCVIPRLNNFVRHLIILKGLDPDYVPPPPPALKETTSDTKPILNIPNMPSWVAPSFKDATQHPIHRIRMGLNKKIPTELAPIENSTTHVTVPEVSINALESLRKEMSKLDHPSSTKSRKSKKIKKSPAKSDKPKKISVAKDFNGYFRRVVEEE